jgi:hypothetical protein
MRIGWQKPGLAIAVALGVVLLFLAPVADAQCSMCRTALTGSNSAFIRNFNIGVLVLLVPPVTIFCSIFFILKRYRAPKE